MDGVLEDGVDVLQDDADVQQDDVLVLVGGVVLRLDDVVQDDVAFLFEFVFHKFNVVYF